ncbi:MAG: DUF2802 domain-containing protein [Deltaproteobacteria bacterium]|nr:DUF2802 domain-containing protein [Deltaproteobacteria bacterium]
MPYLTTEQLFMLSDALCISLFGISAMIIFTMKTKGYGRRLARKWMRKHDNFNKELSLALGGGDPWNDASPGNRRKLKDRTGSAKEKRQKDTYAAARRLAGQGLNVEGIKEKLNLPRNEIELIVKFGRMNAPRSKRVEQGRHDDYRFRRQEALPSASEKIAHVGIGRA